MPYCRWQINFLSVSPQNPSSVNNPPHALLLLLDHDDQNRSFPSPTQLGPETIKLNRSNVTLLWRRHYNEESGWRSRVLLNVFVVVFADRFPVTISEPASAAKQYANNFIHHRASHYPSSDWNRTITVSLPFFSAGSCSVVSVCRIVLSFCCARPL